MSATIIPFRPRAAHPAIADSADLVKAIRTIREAKRAGKPVPSIHDLLPTRRALESDAPTDPFEITFGRLLAERRAGLPERRFGEVFAEVRSELAAGLDPSPGAA